jgi:hypothetical protein
MKITREKLYRLFYPDGNNSITINIGARTLSYTTAPPSLDGRKPENLKVAELKFWLACRGAPVKGEKG